MKSPDASSQARALATLPGLPQDNGGPVFSEPWQAQAFALTISLSESGYFSWTDWTLALGAEFKAAADRGEADDGSRYYDHWVAALEGLITANGLLESDRLIERKNAWADAYRHTPHGKPVELESAAAS